MTAYQEMSDSPSLGAYLDQECMSFQKTQNKLLSFTQELLGEVIGPGLSGRSEQTTVSIPLDLKSL